MIYFFGKPEEKIFAVSSSTEISQETIAKLRWLFGNQDHIAASRVDAFFVGPRAAMVSPWSTNAVEITQNMGVEGIVRIEQYQSVSSDYAAFDPMLQQKFDGLQQDIFQVDITAAKVAEIEDIASYNVSEGLALSEDEVAYLEALSEKLGRSLTDSEVFGFSQVNSEHCRHKIFNGTFVIDGEAKEDSLFQLIKKTSKENPKKIVSAYKDNVAFVEGPRATQFAPKSSDKADYYKETDFDSVLSLKAETHNFPTTVEPFNGAATGSGGEIRDRLAGGQGSLPLAGTAVYMTAYSRLEQTRPWEQGMEARNWLYQTPMDILIKASNGASDFGNKFGQPLISGSVLTFEHEEHARKLGFDKVIMLAGGIGYAKKEQAQKKTPKKGDDIVILGGDNYRIGMGGAAVSSADTGAFNSGIELNAIQRSNPEMQKRVANAIRAMVEDEENTIISIHDHGAGGHLNCLSELVEDTGGAIDLDALPVGDPTLSAKEIIGNESQERMGLVIAKEDAKKLERIAQRERAPMYTVGKVTDDMHFSFQSKAKGEKPMDLDLDDMFGSAPKTIMEDTRAETSYQSTDYDVEDLAIYLEQVLQLEAVACKDWLTNKVDRCVGGRVAKQQCVGPLQLPLNNVGVMALDYKNHKGVATSIGHAPISALIDPAAGSRNAIAESLSNLIWAPLDEQLEGVSLSANWMWPCRNPGEDARLYDAVEAVSAFAVALGINVPTGKDSLSMKQKYPDGDVLSPGTVIISTVGQCEDIRKVVEPVFRVDAGPVYYINLSQDAYALGGSSFAQIRNKVGETTPDIKDVDFFKRAFQTVQELIGSDQIVAGHDVSSGGLITTLLELCFASEAVGAQLDLSDLEAKDIISLLFAENNAIVFQAKDAKVEAALEAAGVRFHKIGEVVSGGDLQIQYKDQAYSFDIAAMRDIWYKTSYLLDSKQTKNGKALERFQNYAEQGLAYHFPEGFSGKLPQVEGKRPKAAIIREKGSNSEREMANAMYAAGFEVKDIHMTDLISGRETLEDIQFIGAVGGFSNSDVLGSAKGWAGSFKYNPRAKEALERFFEREDTLSVGICNGCQLFMELELIHPEHKVHGKMRHNDSMKHESNFTSVTISENHSVMLESLAGSTLGVWISHGEGKFVLPEEEHQYHIVAKYGYDSYPSNPNGSDYNTAMLCDASGRHLVMMPHIERSIYPWNWAYYSDRQDAVSPWLEAFVNARNWILNLEK
ncbi:MAG: phosphoribosylformylglycinamidine synthase [Flavobacteriaceae bacterium]|nr:phosphoribosylformylglycinamidine synthase [Flavobacteriaceae bacterium]